VLLDGAQALRTTRSARARGSDITAACHKARISAEAVALTPAACAHAAAAAATAPCRTTQYYRPQPLWIPISWNMLFLAINGAMIAALVNERREANLLADPQERAVYEDMFAKLGEHSTRVTMYAMIKHICTLHVAWCTYAVTPAQTLALKHTRL
jgi:hypothetical protein